MFEELERDLQYLNDHMVVIGILAEDEEKTVGDGVKIIDYAVWNEDGTKYIPPRPFFRRAIENNEAQIESYRNTRMKKVIRGDLKAEHALKQMGEYVRGLIIQSIATASSWATPNADSTIKTKTSSGNANNTQVLIDDRYLIKSIRYKIVDLSDNTVFISDEKGV